MIFLGGRCLSSKKNGSPFSKKKTRSSSPASSFSYTSRSAHIKDDQGVKIEQNFIGFAGKTPIPTHLNSPKTNKPTPPENRPNSPKKGTLTSEPTFRLSGANLLLVSGRINDPPTLWVVAHSQWILVESADFLEHGTSQNPRWRQGHCQDLRGFGGSRVVSKYSNCETLNNWGIWGWIQFQTSQDSKYWTWFLWICQNFQPASNRFWNWANLLWLVFLVSNHVCRILYWSAVLPKVSVSLLVKLLHLWNSECTRLKIISTYTWLWGCPVSIDTFNKSD